jgi:hypothetical protein
MGIAEDGSNTTYTVTIVRPASSNSFLSDIKVLDGENEIGINDFDSETFEYVLNVDNDVKSVVINGVKESNVASVYGNGTYYLNTGSNEISITCEAEDGSSNVYTIR